MHQLYTKDFNINKAFPWERYRITQYIRGHPINYETAGQFFLGLEPQGNF